VKIFISWSGQKSHDVAVALREWLPSVINIVQPFVSSKDIFAGARWQAEIASELEATNFGIVCVTKENQHAPWLNFEAGALAKAVDSSRLVPLAVDLKPSDIEIPLGQFQAQPANEEGLAYIASSINVASPTPLPEARLQRSVAKWWPDLQSELQKIENSTVAVSKEIISGRTERELLEETLNTVRSLARARSIGGRRGLVGSLSENHPLVSELAAILESRLGGGFEIIPGLDRRLGIRCPAEVPAEIQTNLQELADIYAVNIDFFPLAARREPSTA